MTELLTRHITLFNAGVRTGDFGPMTAWFTDDAEMVFENIPIGPFLGRDAIAAAYASQPPDDEILLLDSRETDGLIVASYTWNSAPGQHAGDRHHAKRRSHRAAGCRVWRPMRGRANGLNSKTARHVRQAVKGWGNGVGGGASESCIVGRSGC